MKLAAMTIVLLLSASSFAENIYVRRTTPGPQVKEEDAAKIRSLISSELASQPGNKLVKTGSQAKVIYHALLNKNGDGFLIKLEAMSGARVVGSNQMAAANRAEFPTVVKKLADMKLDGVTTSDLKANQNEKIPTALPLKTFSVESSDDQTRQSVAVPTVPAEQITAADGKNIAAKHWYISMGPILATSLLGTNIGTRYSVDFGYNFALSERVSIIYLYDGNFNTSSQGSTPVSTIGAAAELFLNDRLSSSSPFAHFDIGYGGANRNEDASASGAVGLGWQFFRTTDFAFEVEVRHVTLATQATTGIGAYPSIDQLRFGIFF